MLNFVTRIGVLGCAKIARRSVIPALKELHHDFKLVAVASRDANKANDFAVEFDCEAIVGYEEMIARVDIDALYVPLPTGLHFEWLSKAILSGKHLYVEKSFASTLAQSNLLVNLAAKYKVALMEGFMFLYHRQQTVVKDIIEDDAFGNLRHFHGCFSFPPLPVDDFRYDEALGGGVLMDAAGYPLRAVHYFCGDSLTVKSSSIFRDPKKGTSLWGSAYLSNGKGMGASIAFGFDNFYQCRYEILGSKAKITAERAYTAGPNFFSRLLLEDSSGSRVINVDKDNHFVGALREFRSLINIPRNRKEHYNQILKQSQSLEKIKDLSKSIDKSE